MSLSYPEIIFGCDPEFFFANKDHVIGAERVLPEEGLSIKRPSREFTTGILGVDSKFVLDGVQIELNPRPHPCRANLGNEISLCFRQLRDFLKKKEDVKVKFDQVIEIPQGELDALCDKAKQLGCAPSKSLHGAAEVKVNAATYTQRSAGGHIHVGWANARQEPERFVRLMDILVGNTSVLLDRDPSCAKRRELYGRAGEYRVPRYGVEYRTLSNFWLRAYPLMSFVMGMTRMAAAVMYSDYLNKSYGVSYSHYAKENDLLKLVDMKDIVQAINTNDFDLAKVNFDKIKPFIEKHVTGESMALNAYNVGAFERFYKTVKARGLEHYFPQDPFDAWCNMPDGHGTGFETFLKGK